MRLWYTLGRSSALALLTALWSPFPSSAAAQPPPDSFVDTLYVQPRTLELETFEDGDTIWVGIGLVNTFEVGGLNFRLEVPDTTRLAIARIPDPMPGFSGVATRLVNRGLPFDRPGTVHHAVIRASDPANVITGVLLDLYLTTTLLPGRGTFMELAFIARPGIQAGDSVSILVRDDLSDPVSPRNGLSDPAGSQAVFPRLRDGFVRFRPAPVILDLHTDLPGNKLWVGQPGNIIFTVDANGYQIAGLTYFLIVHYTNGNWIGPIQDASGAHSLGLPDTNVIYSETARTTFASIGWYSGYGRGSDPDTLLFSFVSFGGPWTGSDELMRIETTPANSGTVTFDSCAYPCGPTPEAMIDVLSSLGESLPWDWLGHGKVVHAAEPVLADIIANCPGTTYEGGSVAIHVGSTVANGAFQSLDLILTTRNGIAAAPANAPNNIGLGQVHVPHATELITSWVPTAGEAGTWRFYYEVTNDLGDADSAVATVEVMVPSLDHAFWNGPYHYEFTPGVPVAANLSWSLTHTSADVQGVVGPFLLSSFSGGAFLADPIVGDGSMGGDITAAPDFASFASKSDNTFRSDAISPDSVVGALISFGAAVPSPGTSVVFNMAASIDDTEGVILIEDPAPPGWLENFLAYHDPQGGTIFPTYSPGCFVVSAIKNLLPTVQCPVTAVGPIIFGDPVSIPGFSYNDPDASPGPYTFSVVSMEKDGHPAVPTNAPSFAGDTFNWLTSNADQNDVGLWEFCVQVHDGADNSTNTCCFTVEVIAQVPVVCFEFGCVEDVLTGSTVCVPLSINNIDPCLELGGFDLLFTYDASVLTFQGLDMVGSVLDAADWEYLTYRIVSTNPALIRIVAIADMNNSNQHPNTLCLDGLIANVCFKVTHDQNAGCQSAHIQWYWNDCGDNTASDPTGNILYIITNPDGNPPYAGGDPVAGINGGGIIMNSCSIDAQLATMEGGISGPDAFPCPNPDTTKPDPIEMLCFINGKIKIICPGDIDDRGDINLNGLAYEIADAVLYSNYFISGPSVFTINVAGQTAASDVNADGTPLTVADLVYLIRVITGDALPIPGDVLGGGPKVTAGQLVVTSVQQGANVTVSAQSDADLGAGLFVFNYSGSDIAGVSAMGRASNMSVTWEAREGQLRVLVLPRMSVSDNQVDRQMVSAGNGPILNITTHGATVELVSVEAATFMGAELETQMEARVLPTQFALKQNFPNPFNPSTSLAIDFPTASEYKLTIYNIAGQTVRSFSGNTEAGTVKLTWDGRDARGTQVATGVYFYSVEAGAFRDTKRMLLLR